jgi:hypothetical protein
MKGQDEATAILITIENTLAGNPARAAISAG